MNQLFESLGLTNSEIKIYKMLLNAGPSQAGKITQKTGIHRRNVYDSLERLIQKGLVAYILENNTKIYSITNPARLQEKIDEQQKALSSSMPELIAKFNTAHDKKETVFFRGSKGIKQVFDDQIRTKKEILVNATTSSVDDVLTHFFPKYQLLRKENKIPTRMIFDSSFNTKHNREKLKKLPLCKFRFVKDFNKSPMSQYIYGDSVSIVVWGETPIAILIRQTEVAQGFRENFEVLWKLGK